MDAPVAGACPLRSGRQGDSDESLEPASARRCAKMSYPYESHPQVLLICHICRFVYHEREAGGAWVTKEAYRRATGIDVLTCRLTHTYCPTCYSILTHAAA